MPKPRKNAEMDHSYLLQNWLPSKYTRCCSVHFVQGRIVFLKNVNIIMLPANHFKKPSIFPHIILFAREALNELILTSTIKSRRDHIFVHCLR